MNTKVKLAFIAILCASCAYLTSCGDDDDSGVKDPETPVEPVKPSEDKALSPAQQKERLEEIALKVSDMLPASDFNDLSTLGHYINDTYLDSNYDWDNVEDWADAVLDDLTTQLGASTTTSDEDTYNYEYWKHTSHYIYTYIDTDYKRLIAISNFTGHFTANNGKWIQNAANDLQFIFTDQNGTQCVLKLETSGKTINVDAGTITEEDYDWDHDSKTENDWTYDTYIYTITQDHYNYTIKVPEHIILTLTQGGRNVVKATVDIDIKNISANNKFDLSKNSLTVASKVELNNGYTFNLSQAAYTANSKASVNFEFTKSNKKVISLSASADVSGMPQSNIDDIDDDDFDDVNGKNVLVKIDVLGELLIQGTIIDAKKYSDYIECAHDNDESESQFKSYINQANALSDINIFYDGSTTTQATFKLESFEEAGYYYRYWKAEPTIYFHDGSSYSTFSAFFNETDFKKVIDKYTQLSDDYKDFISE